MVGFELVLDDGEINTSLISLAQREAALTILLAFAFWR
jgi:hypothetical protein